MIDLTNLEYSEIERFVTETLREPKFRAKQIFGWIYGGLAKDGSFRSGVQSFEETGGFAYADIRNRRYAEISLSACGRQCDRKRLYAV